MNCKFCALSLFLHVFFLGVVFGQDTKNNAPYIVDISDREVPILTNHLKLGSNRNTNGISLGANNFYFTRNGKPWYPVMGEFHYSRYPAAQWEQSILKMKAAGIDIIASYVFWLHHEEVKGVITWK